MDVSRLPRHPKGRMWKRSSHAGTTDLHPDFGPPSYGTPFDVVGDGHDDVAVDFTYASESDEGRTRSVRTPRSKAGPIATR